MSKEDYKAQAEIFRESIQELSESLTQLMKTSSNLTKNMADIYERHLPKEALPGADPKPLPRKGTPEDYDKFLENVHIVEASMTPEEKRELSKIQTRLATAHHRYMSCSARQMEIYQMFTDVSVKAYDGDYEAIMEDLVTILKDCTKDKYYEWFAPYKIVRDMQPEHYKRDERYKRGYTSFKLFLMSQVSIQIKALESYNLPKAPAEALIEDKAARNYKKPAGRKPIKDSSGEVIPALPVQDALQSALIDYMPGGILSNLTRDVLYSSSNVEGIPVQKQRVNRNVEYNVSHLTEGGEEYIRVTRKQKNESTHISLKVPQSKLFSVSSGNTNAKKILNRILIEANKAVKDGELIREVVSFPLASLVRDGMYSSIKSARQAFYDNAGIIASFQFSGFIEDKAKKTIKQGRHVTPFPTIGVTNATCMVRLNPDFNWGLMMQYFIPMPDIYFTLQGKAADLFFLIFQTARANASKIKRSGGVLQFTIKYETIRQALGLRDPRTNKVHNPKQDIKDEISDAIESIEETVRKSAPHTRMKNEGHPAPDLQLLPMVDEEARILDYLDNGKLQITIKGEYAERFIDICRKESGHIEKRQKRQDRIKDAAMIKKLSEGST